MPSPRTPSGHAVSSTRQRHPPWVQKGNKKLYRTAVEVMAPRMGIRVPTLLEMPKAQRHATWIQILARPEMEVLSFNILSTWLIESQRPMLCAWLDALGIKHGDNGCADSFPPQPDAAALKKGVDLLLKQFDSRIVGVTCAPSTRSTRPSGPPWTRIFARRAPPAAEGGDCGRRLTSAAWRD